MSEDVCVCLLAYIKHMELFCQVNVTASLSYKTALETAKRCKHMEIRTPRQPFLLLR